MAASVITSLLLFVGERAISAQGDEIAPGDNLGVVGVPRIPKSLAQQIKRYTGAYGLPLAGWDDVKREIWLKGLSTATWLTRIENPGSTPRMWIYMQEGGVYDIYFQPQSKYFLFNKDTNGNEAFQMYLYDLATRKSGLISDGKSRNTEPVWSNSGEQVIYSCSPPEGTAINLCLINPFDPKSNRLLVKSTGNYLKAYDWSPDDRYAVFCEFTSNIDSKFWLLDVEKGEKRLLSPRQGEGEYYSYPKFGKDGKGVYVITDRSSEFRRLAYVELHTGKLSYLTTDIKWDVDGFQISPDGKTLAFITNEDGVSHIYILDTQTKQKRAIASIPIGVISDLKWHNNSVDLAFNFKSTRTPNDVYSLDIKTEKLERWAQSVSGGVELEKFSAPDLIRWKSFDGRMISGFLYRPPSTFNGKRPVVIDIHGGPEKQHRPGYGNDDNFYINEFGVAKIYPNVRGSSGYGKSFLNLDNGMKREDAVKDIGALLDWIKTQPDLDAERVMVQGSSYGGYVALSAAISFSDRIRGVVSDSGISNLMTTIENTEEWRRSIQRSEFGDERDPKIRTFLEKTAPLNNIQRIKCPLLIIQGKNDPRVPVSEAEAIVQAARKTGIPVWYLLAKDEGHGFVQPKNWEFRSYTIASFIKEYLLLHFVHF
ncbi:MAG: alpha/beta fold hydrolase [Acidobacteria bacterium]|nr:alpha/beta fold hydrolase [Acidobacteriota bacterium]